MAGLHRRWPHFPHSAALPKTWTAATRATNASKASDTWEIPHSWKPHVFKKMAFTEAELEDVIANSPLNGMLDEVLVPPPNAPPLPLDKGHLGLILATECSTAW